MATHNRRVTPAEFGRAIRRDRNQRAGSLFAALSCLVLGCATAVHTPKVIYHYGTQYHGPYELTVLIDDSFSPIETTNLIDGFDVWPMVLTTDNVRFRYGRIGAKEANDGTPMPGEIFVVRYTDSHSLDEVCLSAGKAACWRSMHRKIYYGVDAVTAGWHTTIATHEMGHALGIAHCQDKTRICTLPSVMSEESDTTMSQKPNEDDISEFCYLHGCIERQ